MNSRPTQRIHDSSSKIHRGYRTHFPITSSDEQRIRQAALKRERKTKKLEAIHAR